ncbi:MAG TPA: bifunctional precorrin-2 dehydrogenase/sirohydrochlorin ferrochelatase [Methanocorpusculum sp.]|nr:bifunctional precorrin-2 dehydrogenase/sirohydrochlorin ferrochelatase [Methanocorpusculum sp.]
MIPLTADVSALRVLVFGTGAVGTRKAAYFKPEAKEVRLLGKSDTPSDDAELESLIREYDIIIAASDDAEFNTKITGIASRGKKWYNSATSAGNFLIPAVFHEGDLSVAVSTNGKAPAAAAFIRDAVKSAYPALPQMVELQNTLRTLLKTAVPSQQIRAEILQKILHDDAVWKELETGSADAREILRRYV